MINLIVIFVIKTMYMYVTCIVFLVNIHIQECKPAFICVQNIVLTVASIITIVKLLFFFYL